MLALILAVSFSTEAKVKSDARYNIIYIGNSITYGALHADRNLTAPPAVATREASKKIPQISGQNNCGRSGATTVDFLPALNRDFRRLQVSDFSYHHDIRVLTDNTAQSGGKGDSDLVVHLDLAQTGSFVFHRVFDGDDLFTGIVELIDNAVQGGGLTAPRGAHNKDDSVGDLDKFFKLGKMFLRHAEGLEVKTQSALIQKSQNDTFTGKDGNGTDTHIKFSTSQFHIGTSILRQTAFGDIQTAQKF